MRFVRILLTDKLTCRSNFSPEQRSLRHAGSLLVGLLATRLARGWNQTGQKHAGGPDIVKNFLLTDPGLLWRMVTCTYLWMYLRILGVVTTSSSSGPASTYLAVASTTVLVALAAAFKLHFAHEDSPELVVGHVPFLEQLLALLGGISLVRKAQLVFAHLAASVLFLSIRTRGSGTPRRGFLGAVRDHVLLLLATQTRLANIPLLFLLDRQVALLGASVEQQQQLDAVSLSGASLVLQFASFFAFGGSNAISSVDLSSAYNGVAGFSVGLVGVLIFVSNWAGPIYVSLCTAMLLLRLGDRDGTHGKTDVFLHYVAAVTLFTVCSLCFVMAACTVLRTHLFIWTVFSPKYLYSMAWSLGQHLIVNIGVVGLFLILDGKPAGNSRQATSETG